jgi:hypothetical protein
MSHSVDRLIGNTIHHGPQPQPPPMYGTPQYHWHTGAVLITPTPLSTTIPYFYASTHQWATVGTPHTPTYSNKFWYPLYLSL